MRIFKKKVLVESNQNWNMISFDVINNTNVLKEAVLFDNLNSVNINRGLEIKSESPLLSYEEFCLLKTFRPLEVNHIHISTQNFNQIEEKISILKTNLRGVGIEDNILVKKHPYQEQQGVVVVYKEITIDFYTKLKYLIQPNTRVTFSFFLERPKEVVYVSIFKLAFDWLKSKFKNKKKYAKGGWVLVDSISSK